VADGRYRTAGTFTDQDRALEVAQAAEAYAAELTDGAPPQLDPVTKATMTIEGYVPGFLIAALQGPAPVHADIRRLPPQHPGPQDRCHGYDRGLCRYITVRGHTG
jgi:hypothetical protein